tara:strand:- start:12920 stop:13114 length:195 start_codon:yes stop_codon:yes gene_type:complete
MASSRSNSRSVDSNEDLRFMRMVPVGNASNDSGQYRTILVLTSLMGFVIITFGVLALSGFSLFS